MNYAPYTTAILFTILTINYCEGQNQSVPPLIQRSFDSLYPGATHALWEDKPISTNTRRVSFDCNCPEGLGHLLITFDMNGNVLDKDVVISEKDLPGNITGYVESNYPNNSFKYGEITKISKNQADVSYRIELLQTNPDGTVTDGGWVYILKFKASGEFISMDKRLQNN